MVSRSASRRGRPLSESEKRALISRQVESGKSVSGFCQDEGIALSSFQSWKKKFSGSPVFVEVGAKLPVRTAVPVEVVFACGDKVVTTSECDPAWLALLIHSFGRTPC